MPSMPTDDPGGRLPGGQRLKKALSGETRPSCIGAATAIWER
jgi:hypothetical protein